MLDNHASLLALRARLKTVQAVTTGPMALEATSDGYIRATGSFVDDGFVPGQELLPAGFEENPPAVIQSVTATEIKVRQTRIVEASAAGRSLTVGVPSIRAWENVRTETDKDLWNIVEEYLPGPSPVQESTGPLGWITTYPTYLVTLRGHKGIGSQALYKVADAILASFPPRDALTLADGTILRIRSAPCPMRGQVMQDEDGFSFVVVTIPIWARTQNII